MKCSCIDCRFCSSTTNYDEGVTMTFYCEVGNVVVEVEDPFLERECSDFEQDMEFL